MQPRSSSESKADLRAHFRSQRRNLSQVEQLNAAKSALQQCCKLEAFNAAKTVALYLSNDGELDPQFIIEYCWNSAITVYLPVLHPSVRGSLAFIKYTSSTPMQKNRYGISEPKLDVSAIIKVENLDLVFTPLVAFDNNGHRLGMGGGYYDRTLASLNTSNKTHLIGLAHDCQHASNLTSESWDIPLSTIVTPTRVINII